MAAIQNFKNFLRHGKQAAEPTTNVSNVHGHAHAQQNRHHPDHQYAHSDPNVLDPKPLQANAGGHGDYSAAVIDNRHIAAQAGNVAARDAADRHKKHAHDAAGTTDRKGKEVDPTVLERIVAEEREAKGKLPNYPGLERWTLLEKMGDGAFSNVYRAKDNTGQYGEAAIKVVRKFEMNSSQVSIPPKRIALFSPFHYVSLTPLSQLAASHPLVFCAVANTSPDVGRSSYASGFQKGPKNSRCAITPQCGCSTPRVFAYHSTSSDLPDGY
jgi:hypothetical protein